MVQCTSPTGRAGWLHKKVLTMAQRSSEHELGGKGLLRREKSMSWAASQERARYSVRLGHRSGRRG